MDISPTLSATVIAVVLIAVTGAALLTGHASFDQFLGIAGGSGGVVGVLHAAGLKVSSSGSSTSGGA